MAEATAVRDRFLSKVKTNGDGCWIWTRKIVGGYGYFKMNRPSQTTHRRSVERHVGPIPDGPEVDPLCFVTELPGPPGGGAAPGWHGRFCRPRWRVSRGTWSRARGGRRAGRARLAATP